ncbi:hypothetical protein J7E96_36175 [Streptomyces sp. ISL-96]|uniref:hypothetical protein n=1 Tax=Streptomyces sp. ISL-96 TaxID=2819191 RepID=UPI001BE6A3EF|nr:hypothetical protein [Streptomyces sp. ISL-96]MBT2493838.1 hypothetical protein [Streptomyces sp. ISL-96]
MTDRRRRAALRLPLSAMYAGQRGSQLLLRDRQSSSTPPTPPPPPPSQQGDDNPFAPPPEGQPDQPWQPRKPADGGGGQGDGSDEQDAPSSSPSSGGSQWSPRQPGRQSGGFGGPGERQGGPEGPGDGKGGGGTGPGLRWDPTDPAQRRARYALLSGMWAFFFALFDLPEVALLLGALALYWGISSLRAKPRRAQDAAADATTTPAPASPSAGSSRPQTTAAVSGLVTAALALMIVATTFTVQLVYRDYYTCVQDSLTQSAQATCNDLLPKPLRPIFGVKE